MKYMMKMVLSIMFASLLFSAKGYAVEFVTTSQTNPVSDQSGESSIRGDFISLSTGRLLKTSVGEYVLSSLSVVDDKRGDKDTSSKVVITLRGDIVKHVIIY